MAAKYHLTSDGVKACTAFLRPCPYNPAEHYSTREEAEAAYERKNEERLQRVLAKTLKPIASKPPLRGEAAFNEEGLTANVEAFRTDLLKVNDIIKGYSRYRNTGLNEEKYIPTTALQLLPFLDERKLKAAFRAQDYSTVRAIYLEAYQDYYMSKVFTDEDIDCLFEDDEIEGFLYGDRS